MGDKLTEQDLQEYEDEIEDEMEEEKVAATQEEIDLREDLTDDDNPGAPKPDPAFERYKFLTEARDNSETIRTSFVTKEELGVPLFSIRFWLDLELIATQKKLELLKRYLHGKALVTTDTGYSREGFFLNTSITRRRELARNKTKYSQEVSNAKQQKG